MFCQNFMVNRVRILLALLVAFTLPWQAVAAATRVHCLTMGSSAISMHALPHAADSHRAHVHAADAAVTDGHRSHDVPADTSTSDGKAECSAFCCAATISASNARVLLPMPLLELLPDIAVARPIYEPDGFYRPPRT